MVTLDVKNLYTNIDNNEGLRVVEEELEKRATKNTPSFAVTLLMKMVPILNNFVFSGVKYLQKKGTAMGTRTTSDFADVFMGYFENRFVYQSRWFKRFIKSWWRYIDDIFMLWKGPRKPLEDFLNYLNEVHSSIKFEWKISKHKVSFLDCDVIKENNKLKTDVYEKPTDCHSYRDYTSAHPSHFKTSISYSQALQLRRICDDQETLKKRIRQCTDIGCSSCQRCSWCKSVEKTTVFRSRATGKEFQIYHSVCCKSSYWPSARNAKYSTVEKLKQS